MFGFNPGFEGILCFSFFLLTLALFLSESLQASESLRLDDSLSGSDDLFGFLFGSDALFGSAWLKVGLLDPGAGLAAWRACTVYN